MQRGVRMKRYKDLEKNRWATIHNDLVYTAIIHGVYVYHGYSHEMPNESLVVVYPDLVGGVSPLSDGIIDLAIRLKKIFLLS